MRNLGSYLVLIACVTTFVAKTYILLQAFRVSPFKAFLCILIPGYMLYFGTTKHTRQTKALISWGIGLLLFIIGLVTS
jgi:hypothetical protein